MFGRPIEKLDQSMLRGDIDKNRNVATTAEEKLANQAQLLLKLTKGREKAVADMSVEMQSQVSQLEVMKTNLKDMVLEQDNLIKKGESSRRLNKEIFDLRNRITLKEQNIAKLTSVQQEELKKGRDSLAQLLIIQRGFEASVEKTVFNLQNQALQLKIRALATDIKIAEVGRKERLANEKAITAELKAQNDAQQQFLKGIGGLNRFEELEFLRERVKNEKSLAKVTRDVQKERAQGDLDRANKRLELDILTTNRQIQVTIDQIESTLDLIEVLNNVGEELNNLANELSGKKSTFNKVPVQERREFLFGGEKDKA